jgi:hypothetical protein
MNKFIKSAFAFAMMAFAFTSCEDVPAPYDLNYNNGGSTEVTVEPAGEGTEASPYNVAKALQIITEGVQTESPVVVKGFVTKVEASSFDPQFGSLIYYIADTKGGKTTLEVYRGMSFGGAKFASASDLKVDDEVVFSGVLIIYNATKEVKQGSSLISVNGVKGSTTPETPSTSIGDPVGEGTEASPYNIAKAQSIIAGLEADKATEDVYISGTVVGTPTFSTKYSSATYYLSDDGTEAGKLYIYGGKSFNGDNFTADNMPMAGDKVVLKGKLINYKGNTPEVTSNSQLISVNGKTSSTPNTGGSTGGEGAGDAMTAALIASGAIGGVTLDTNKYGNQSTSDENTWYTWKYNNITYKGAKVCISEGKNGEGIQMQGNANDASKQGFLFNADAFGTDIAKVTVVMSVAKSGTYEPSYSFYAGTTAHPSGTAITATPAVTENGNYKEYTYVYDLSSASYKFFTIANDKVGALYIKSIKITLK